MTMMMKLLIAITTATIALSFYLDTPRAATTPLPYRAQASLQLTCLNMGEELHVQIIKGTLTAAGDGR